MKIGDLDKLLKTNKYRKNMYGKRKPFAEEVVEELNRDKIK